jgi:hypothetical protein
MLMTRLALSGHLNAGAPEWMCWVLLGMLTFILALAGSFLCVVYLESKQGKKK